MGLQLGSAIQSAGHTHGAFHVSLIPSCTNTIFGGDTVPIKDEEKTLYVLIRDFIASLDLKCS